MKAKYDNILGFIAGVGLIVLTMDSSSLIGRVVSFAGLLIAIRFLVQLFNSSDALLQRILPNKNRVNLIDKKLIYYLSTSILFIGLVLLIIELLQFERVLRPGDFWKIYYFFGIVLALLTVYSLPIISSDLYATGKRRFSITWGILIGLPFIVLSIASMTNRIWSSSNLRTKQYVVVDRDAIKTRRSKSLNYQLTIPIDKDHSKDLVVDEILYQSTSIGDSITLVLKNGLLNFEIIQEIKTNANNGYNQ